MEQIEKPIPGWQERLVEERAELLKKLIALKNKIDDPSSVMSCHEWEMLKCQCRAMREYLQCLTDRCVYYKLIPAADLGISY